MEEQNRFKLEISEEMLELREFRDEMREDNRYVAEEIPKSQAEINEELYAFKSEFKEEFAQFRAQNDEQMADIRSKLDAIMDLLHEMRKSKGLEPLDMIGAPLDQVNSDPEDTIGDVAACDEKSEPNVQKVEAFISTTPIAESEIYSKVCTVFDELTESSPAVLLKGPVIEPCARYLFDETPKLLPVDSDGGVYEKISSSKTEVLEIGHHLIDEMPELTSAEQNKRVDAHEELILLIVVFPRDLSYGSKVTKVSSFKSNLEEGFMFVDLKNQLMNAAFWINGILMFIFDPGGCSLPQMGCDPFEFNGEKGEFRFTTIGVDTLVKAITHKCLILNASVGRDVVLYPYKSDEEDVYYNEVTWYNPDIVKSMLIIYDLCIQRYHRMYMPNDKMQACTAIFGLHKCDVNRNLLVLIAANSIPPWVVLHQLMFPMKVYGILVLLKGEDSARHMVVGAVLIQVKNDKSLWSKGRNMKANHAIHLYLCSSSTTSCIDPIAELIATMLTSSFTRTGMVFPHLGECKRVLSLINNDLMFLITLSRSSLLRAWDWNDLFYHGWGDIFKLIARAFFSVFEHLVSIGVIDVDLQTYVWEPGQYMIPYILEDKDVLKRKGIGIRLALKQYEELNGILTEIDLEIDLSFKEEFYIPAIVVPIGWFLDSKGKNLGELSISPLKKSSVCLLKQNVVELIQKFHELFIIDLDHLPTSVKECNQTALAGLEPLLQMVSVDVSKDTEDVSKDTEDVIWKLIRVVKVIQRERKMNLPGLCTIFVNILEMWPFVTIGGLAETLVKFVFRGFVVVSPAGNVSMLDIHESETFGHIVRNLKFQDGAYKIADELKTALTNGISTCIEMMDQGQHIYGVNNFTECLPMGYWLYVCEVFLDTISMILVDALVLFVQGLVIEGFPTGAAILKIFVWDPGISHFHHLEDKAVVEGKDLSCPEVKIRKTT